MLYDPKILGRWTNHIPTEIDSPLSIMVLAINRIGWRYSGHDNISKNKFFATIIDIRDIKYCNVQLEKVTKYI